MNNQRLISFDIQADFGFFKKPDYNDGVLLTYNMLHKPALLGILGLPSRWVYKFWRGDMRKGIFRKR